MAELAAFNDYEKEFLSVTGGLPTRINALVQYETNSEAAQSELRRIKSDVATAKQHVSDMEMANRSIPEPTRRDLGNKIRRYKDTLAEVQKDLGSAEAKFSRSALMGGAGGRDRPLDFDRSTNQRERMQQSTDKLRGGTDQLNDAHRRVEETINVGGGIMEELQRNRETLSRVRGNVGEVSGTLDVARRILRSMSKREVQNKIAVGVFAFVMIGIIAIVIYFIQKNKSENQ